MNAIFGALLALYALDEPRLVERARSAPGGAPAEQLAFSPCDDAFATASGERVVLWEAGRKCASFELHDDVACLAFDPLGRYLVGAGGSTAIWDREHDRLALELPQCHAPAAWSPDGRYLVVKDRSGAALVLERDRFVSAEWRAMEPARGGLQAVLWDGDGSGLWIAAGGCVARFDLEEGRIQSETFFEMPPRARGVRAMARWRGELAVFARSGDVLIHGRRELRVRTPDQVASTVDGSRCVAANIGHGGVWELSSGEPIYHPVPGVVSAIAFDSRGRLAVAKTDGSVHLDALAAPTSPASFDAQLFSRVTSLAFTPDERFVVAAGARVAMREIATNGVREISRAGALSAGRRGSEFLIATDSAIEAWDAERGELERTWPARMPAFGRPGSISLAPDGRSLLVGPVPDFGSYVECLDLESGVSRVVGRVVALGDVAWSEDGKLALGVHLLPSCFNLSPMIGRLQLIELAASSPRRDTPFAPKATGAFFADGDRAVIWSEVPELDGAPGGLYRRGWPEGAVEQLSTQGFDRLRRIDDELLIGAGRSGIALCSSVDGRTLQQLELDDLQRDAAVGAELAVSASGRWVAIALGSEVRVYELVR